MLKSWADGDTRSGQRFDRHYTAEQRMSVTGLSYGEVKNRRRVVDRRDGPNGSLLGMLADGKDNNCWSLCNRHPEVRRIFGGFYATTGAGLPTGVRLDTDPGQATTYFRLPHLGTLRGQRCRTGVQSLYGDKKDFP